MLSLILVVFAFVLFCIAAAVTDTAGRWRLGWAGLAFYMASILAGSVQHLIR